MSKTENRVKTERLKNKKSTSGSVIKATIIMILLAAMLVGFYFYLSHKMETSEEKALTLTKTQQVLLRDLDKNYPPSPKEVIKYYGEINQCIYNEVHSDEELKDLALKLQKLFDIELIAGQNQDQFLTDLKKEVSGMQKSKLTIFSFSTSASTDVEYSTMDGREWAKLYCTFNMHQGTSRLNSAEQFLLRLDEDGHWKIYGWELADKNYDQKLDGQ